MRFQRPQNHAWKGQVLEDARQSAEERLQAPLGQYLDCAADGVVAAHGRHHLANPMVGEIQPVGEKPTTGHLVRVWEKIRLQDKPLIHAFPMEAGRKPCLRILQSLQRILMTEKKTPLQVLTFGLQGSF